MAILRVPTTRIIAVLLALIAFAPDTVASEEPVGDYLVAWATERDDPDGGPVRVEAFGTLAEAARVATGGAVDLPRDATMEDLVAELERIEPEIGDTIVMSDTLIGIDYDAAFFGGPHFLWTVPNGVGCTTGLSYHSNMPAGWNDRVSSARAYGGCNRFAHYSGANQTGLQANCTCSSMGLMDNVTRSVSWEQ